MIDTYLRIYLTNDSFNAKQILLASLVAGLILMTRMDNALLAFPLMLFVLWKRESMSLLRAFFYGCVGLLPFITWEIFSVLYYGFPFPNTAYAKLGTGFPLSDYLLRGANYFLVALFEDPLVLVFPCLFIVRAIISKSVKYLMPAVGIVLYYVYIIYIGGDFMFGRHFTVPFFAALFCLFSFNFDAVASKVKKILICCVALQLLVVNSNFYYDLLYKDIYFAPTEKWTKFGEITNERAYYFPETSLFYSTLYKVKVKQVSTVVETAEGGEIMYKGVIVDDSASGTLVFYNDGIYFSDPYGLGDPLLARLPAIYTPDWRVGHMQRDIPDGYQESIQTGENHIQDSALHEYLNIIWEITRSEDIFTKSRIEKIININMGKYDYLIEQYTANRTKN